MQPARESSRDKRIVKSHMGIPGRKRVATFVGMQRPESITIIGIQHELNGLALQFATAHPNRGPDPGWQAIQLQHLTRRQSIEISYQQMEAGLVSLDPLQQ